ncbi:hypothetical protein OROMI_029991 [Orobanche minor]
MEISMVMRRARIEQMGHEKVDLAFCDSSYHTGTNTWFSAGVIFYVASKPLFAAAIRSQGVDRRTSFEERNDPLKVHEIQEGETKSAMLSIMLYCQKIHIPS